jgi:hypothetical protein
MVVGALLLVGGCANMGALSFTQATLLEEYQQIRSGSATQTEMALREREQLQLQSPSEINRVRLALVLGFGRGAATDPKRALQLFDESSKKVDGRPSDVALFAEVFAGILKERLQAETRITAAEAKIGAAETKASAAEAKITALSREAESERERANELEKKLEALKSIEKSLHKR